MSNTGYRISVSRRNAFTLLELMLAVSILSLISTVTYLTFSTVTTAWKRGMAMADDLHHGDFVLEQLVMGLKSAYFPDIRGGNPDYGFLLENNGNGAYSGDTISWTKVGAALVGEDRQYAGSPHRIRFSIENDESGRSAAAIRAWRFYDEDEDFDSEKDVEPVFLSTRITGFDCELKDPESDSGDEIEWLDEWEHTNKLPTHISITLYLEPIDVDQDPIELRRIVEIPAADLSWR